MTQAATHRLQCTDVWGGFEAIDTGVSVPGLDVWVYSRPFEGQQAGGDLHYLSLCSAGELARVLLADVSGHGEGVAELADTLHRSMRQHVETVDQSEMARQLNRTFARHAETGRFATAAIVSHKAGELVTVNAGHPAPLWYQAQRDRWCWLEPGCDEAKHDVTGLPLGVIDGTDYQQFAVTVGEGDVVLLYTDALIESRKDGGGAMLGGDGLMRLAHGLDRTAPAAFGRRLRDAVHAYSGDTAPADDLTMITLYARG